MVKVPIDRTDKQTLRGYCLNLECIDPKNPDRFEFDADQDDFACPKCKESSGPTVGLLVLTHYLAPNPKGPIAGNNRRFHLACDPKRTYIATVTNLEAATDQPALVTCPGCRGTKGFKALTSPRTFGTKAEPQNV